jgi:polyribonucleotide nucleotidyltransferase
VNEGDRIDVKLLETNDRGQLKLSRREVLLDEGGDEVRAQLEEAKQAREEARDARKAEAEGGAQSEGGGWGEDRGGGNPDDRRRGRPPPKARRGRTRLRE